MGMWSSEGASWTADAALPAPSKDPLHHPLPMTDDTSGNHIPCRLFHYLPLYEGACEYATRKAWVDTDGADIVPLMMSDSPLRANLWRTDADDYRGVCLAYETRLLDGLGFAMTEMDDELKAGIYLVYPGSRARMRRVGERIMVDLPPAVKVYEGGRAREEDAFLVASLSRLVTDYDSEWSVVGTDCTDLGPYPWKKRENGED